MMGHAKSGEKFIYSQFGLGRRYAVHAGQRTSLLRPQHAREHAAAVADYAPYAAAAAATTAHAAVCQPHEYAAAGGDCSDTLLRPLIVIE